MSNYGVKIKIDVTKIDKELLFRGKKGTYLDAILFLKPDEPGQYGDHGMITQDVSKEAKERGEKGNILGNAEVFWRSEEQAQRPQQQVGGQAQRIMDPQQQQYGAAPAAEFEEDENIPF